MSEDTDVGFFWPPKTMAPPADGREIGHGFQCSDDVKLTLGDCVRIGPGVRITGKGSLVLQDYVTIHQDTWIIVNEFMTIGHNTWIGQGCILDGTGKLYIGDNCGIGARSQIWTHLVVGSQLNGCRLRSVKSITMQEESWLTSDVLLTSDLGMRSVVLAGGHHVLGMGTGGDLSKFRNRIYGGRPAEDVTDRMGGAPWQEKSLDWKVEVFRRLTQDYREGGGALSEDLEGGFNLTEMTYPRTRTAEERQFMRFLLRENRAKFLPKCSCDPEATKIGFHSHDCVITRHKKEGGNAG